MGCTQSTLVEDFQKPAKKAGQQPPSCGLECQFWINNRLEKQCIPPNPMRRYNSWDINNSDIQGISRRMPRPISGRVDQKLAKKMSHELSFLVKDPAAFQRCVLLRRLQLDEELQEVESGRVLPEVVTRL